MNCSVSPPTSKSFLPSALDRLEAIVDTRAAASRHFLSFWLWQPAATTVQSARANTHIQAIFFMAKSILEARSVARPMLDGLEQRRFQAAPGEHQDADREHRQSDQERMSESRPERP